MTPLEEHGQRWRPAVAAELERIRSPLPSAIVLAAWWNESRGIPGVVNESGAAGLGQVKPVALDFYNSSTSSVITMADMSGTSANSIALQTRVSVWLYNWHFTRARAYLGPQSSVEEQYKLGLLSYHQGWSAVRSRLESLKKEGLPATFESLRAHYPSGWAAQGGEPFTHQEKNWIAFEKLRSFFGDVGPLPPPKPPDIEIPPPSTFLVAGAILLGLGLVAVAVAMLVRGGK